MKLEDDVRRYEAALHAMQSGVAAAMNLGDGHETEPKHLRVGINSAMCEHTALVRLLMAKGIITEEEFYKELADEMEREKERYEKTLSKNGRTITLL